MDTSTKVVLTFMYAVIFPVSLLGNTLVLYVVYKRRSMRNVLNLLLVNMAIADLLVTVLIMPYSVTFLYLQFQWFGGIFGSIVCKIVHMSSITSVAASIFTLSVMTVDRLISIVFLWKQSLTLRSSKVVILIIWLFSFAFMGIHLKVFKVQKAEGTYICIPDWSFTPEEFPKYFVLGLFIVLYALPLLLMAVMYSIIIRYLWKNNFANRPKSGTDSSVRKSKKRVVKMLITVTVAFMVCWLPLHVNHYYIYFDFETYRCLPFYVILLSFFVGHANSAVNPFIYVIFNQGFRRAFLDALCIKQYESLNLQSKNRRSRAATALTTSPNGNFTSVITNTSKKGRSTRFTPFRQKTYAKLALLPGNATNEKRNCRRYSKIVVSERLTSV